MAQVSIFDLDGRDPNKDEEKLKKKMLTTAEKDRVRLLMSQPFIGSIIMRLELITVVDSRITTACTDGSRIFISAPFYKSLTADQRLFVLCHEVWHTALQHFERKQSRNHNIFNYATDLEIQFILVAEKMKPPWLLDFEPSWEGLNAEEIYEKLLRDKRAANYSCDNIYKNTDCDSLDTDKADARDNVDKESGTAGEDDGKDYVFDSEFKPLFEPDIAERSRSRVITAAQTLERTQGSLPAHIADLIEAYREAKLPWRDILAQFVTSSYGESYKWLPPNRRYISQGLYLQSRRSEKIQAVVAIDTSGSMSDDLQEVLSELIGILTSFGKFDITVMDCDAEVQNVREFSSSDIYDLDVDKFVLELSGFGGTSFTPVFDYIDENNLNPNLLLFFTDGYGDAPDNPPSYPTLWVLTHDHQVPAEWCQTIVMHRP